MVLHLWQAVQIVIDVAVWACVGLGLGSPPSYGARFGRWASRGAFYDTAIAATAVAQGRAASVSGGVNEALGHTVVRGWPPRRRVEAVVACEAEQGAIQAEELAAQERAGHEVATTVRARSGQGGA